MNAPYIQSLVPGTADPAFAVDVLGQVSGWNRPAEELFGLSSEQAIGRPCHEVLQGTDDCGVTCSEHCVIQQALEHNRRLANFDLKVKTKNGQVVQHFNPDSE